MRITLKMALAFRGCLSRKKILELADGRQWINHRTLTKLGLKPSEIIWFIEKLEIGGKIRYLLYADIAESVLHIFENKFPDDKQPRNAIEGIRKFVAGIITEKELEIIAYSADAAASAYSAAAAFAAAAAYSAYAAAAAYYAYAAAVNATKAADNKKEEQNKQIKMIDKYLKSVA